MLVVVHPDLENMALDTNIHTELLDCQVIVFLNPPTQLFCEGAHLIFLLLRELGPKPFFHSVASHVHGMSTGTAHHVIVVLNVADRHDHLRMGARDTGGTRGQRQGHVGTGQREVKHATAGPLAAGAIAVATVAAVIAGGGAARGVGDSSVVGGVSSVEITVAATGSALEGLESAFVTAGHELAAAIVCVATDAGRMVLQAFSIFHAAWLCDRRRRRCRRRLV